MSFQEVSEVFSKLVKSVADVYRGYHQYTMIETICCGMLIGEPVLLIGSHGVFKTSMAAFIGNLFDKPVVTLRHKFKGREELEKFFDELAGRLNVDCKNLMSNLVDGVNIEYEQYNDVVTVNIEIDLVKHPAAETLGSVRRVPVRVFNMQVNDQMDPEDIMGYSIDHPAILGQKPPHAVKSGKISGADIVVIDECFNAPRLLSKLHHALNEKVVDTNIGQIETKPLAWILATNPLNQFYQTNLQIVNVATADRYALSARSLPPSAQEVLLMNERWKKMKLAKKIPVELVYQARKYIEEVTIPEEFIVFCMGIVSHLSRCYFATSTSVRYEESKDPFETDKECSLCIYNEYPCGLANVGKVRTMIRLQQAMKAHAFLNMRQTADYADLNYALLAVLPHRLSWNNKEFLAQYGSIYTATKELINKYILYFTSSRLNIREIEDLIKKPDATQAKELREKYADALVIRALLDEIIDMIKEAARKKDETTALDILEPQLKLKMAIESINASANTATKAKR
ncbi:MAG: hypothetical protein QXR63_00020 [Candidatus Bathyarchaeia archaeon]